MDFHFDLRPLFNFPPCFSVKVRKQSFNQILDQLKEKPLSLRACYLLPSNVSIASFFSQLCLPFLKER